jgi:uncharacterized membrane protein
MTLPEIMGIFGAIAGAIILSIAGQRYLGWAGIIVGVIGGLIGGCFAGFGIIKFLSRISFAIERHNQKWLLRKSFWR